ncbi:hypothetical protein N0V93_002033 [Gnomoniopsis smithogilvyi]|uniref:Methyltransferase type 11 domain-containing protein n=1 Tax=Gnomoniopsis smithogilvyi TaxID=1191159 RepID=A0A9W8Z2R7_9PEZI|nr:hypothetical protein N0V93_002033 [Gnomoniopsis smithogilvyi]
MSSTTASNVYSHGHSAATVAGHATRTAEFCAAYLLPHLSPGASLLDVGCGPGSITSTFVPYVSPGGRVVGVDSSAAVIATAQSQFGSGGAEFLVGDIFQLPFEDGTFDFVYAHQVIVHLPLDKVGSAFREMKRVCKAGGLVTFRDARAEKGGLQAFPNDPLLPQTMQLFCERVYLNSGVTPDSVGRFLKIARDEVGFRETKRQFSLDVFEGKELREMWGNQWMNRTGEEGFKSFVREKGLASEEELAELPKAWAKWRDTEDGWCTLLQIEHLCWK